MTTTIETICSKYSITQEQFSKATHCTMNGEHFYIVESQSEVGKEYHVKFNRQFGKLTCTCKAGEQGIPCWRECAALAAEEHYKATERAQRLNEQAEVEATEEYQLEQLFRELEDTLDALDALAQESDERDALRQAGLNV